MIIQLSNWSCIFLQSFMNRERNVGLDLASHIYTNVWPPFTVYVLLSQLVVCGATALLECISNMRPVSFAVLWASMCVIEGCCSEAAFCWERARARERERESERATAEAAYMKLSLINLPLSRQGSTMRTHLFIHFLSLIHTHTHTPSFMLCQTKDDYNSGFPHFMNTLHTKCKTISPTLGRHVTQRFRLWLHTVTSAYTLHDN